MGSEAGALRTAARRLGLDPDDYARRVAAGLRWCTRCKAWHPRSEFGRDASRSDGLMRACRHGRREHRRRTFTPVAEPRRGNFIRADRRDGDAAQARARVNYLVQRGELPHPNTLICEDCGHIWAAGERRHEYDHYRGYSAEHHEDVEAVCTTCHAEREKERR